VAVVLTEGAVVIDYAGRGSLLQCPHGSGSMGSRCPSIFTPWGATATIHTAGVMKRHDGHPGLRLCDAPDPDVVVVGPNREMTSSVRGCGKSTRRRADHVGV